MVGSCFLVRRRVVRCKDGGDLPPDRIGRVRRDVRPVASREKALIVFAGAALGFVAVLLIVFWLLIGILD